MRRDQLEHAIRTACQITGQPEVIVIGSQAILGTYPEYELPHLATRSMEVDILPITDDNNTTVELADLIVGVAGELSPFEQTHGFSIDGVDLTTAALPEGWSGFLWLLTSVHDRHRPPQISPSVARPWCRRRASVSISFGVKELRA